MLSVEKVHEVRQLLAVDLTYREIARRTQVSVCSVDAIANERRAWEEPDEYQLAGGPVERCSRCGRTVEMPCRACLAEDARDDDSIETTPDAPGADCAPELFGDERGRYEAVREARIHAMSIGELDLFDSDSTDPNDELAFVATDTLLSAFELEDEHQPDFLEEQYDEPEYE